MVQRAGDGAFADADADADAAAGAPADVHASADAAAAARVDADAPANADAGAPANAAAGAPVEIDRSPADAPDERIVGEQGAPAWLPAGSRVQWVTGAMPPSPMGLVRLLIRDGDRVFCVPRERNGKLDLPTREVGEADPTGLNAILALSLDITGSDEPPRWVGAVRNIVPDPSGDYRWPVPIAHFGVWQVDNAPRVDGQWLDAGAETSSLKERHWFPLIARDDLP
ncbi:hypothetical protein [Microbacterium sp. NPDC056052]|uniref:hypothetical protein n=1 Tax=Microbacterium sp. NPDC056052 TaxID=3345695 RepID=UPI0035D8FC80